MTYVPIVHALSEWEDPARPVDATYSEGKVGQPPKGTLISVGTAPRTYWPNVDTAVPHYTAADDLIDGDVGENWAGIPAYIRQIQSSYSWGRGYSIGYNWVVDMRGHIWPGRGWSIRNAANRDHNSHSFAILCLVDGADAVTPEAAAAIRWLIGEGEKLAKRELLIIGHGQLQNPNHPTGCPGIGIRMQIEAGLFSPRYDAVDPPVEPPVEPPIPPIFPPNTELDMSVVTHNPVRILDTRSSSGKVNGVIRVPVHYQTPATATAVLCNVASVDATRPGFFTMWGSGDQIPTAAVLNVDPKDPSPKNGYMICPISEGKFYAYGNADAHFIIDQSGYVDGGTALRG